MGLGILKFIFLSREIAMVMEEMRCFVYEGCKSLKERKKEIIERQERSGLARVKLKDLDFFYSFI